MAWTTPRTWATNELVTANMMNEQVRDNLEYLMNPNQFRVINGGTYTTTSTSYVNVNALFSINITSNGGHWLIGVQGTFSGTSGGGTGSLAIGYDGANEQSVMHSAGVAINAAAFLLIPNLSAGSHSFQLRFRHTGGTTSTFQGNAGNGLPIIFWGIEL